MPRVRKGGARLGGIPVLRLRPLRLQHVQHAWGADVRRVRRATGTRELHAASPFHLVERVDAVVLTGGSAYGLDATAGAMRWMEERGRGHPVGGGAGVVPIIPAA